MISAITDLIGGILSRRHQRKQAEHQADLEQIRAGQMERANGWKDEIALIVTAAPFVAIFIPSLQEPVRAGFEALRTDTPDWYQWLLVASLAAAQGISVKNKWFKGK